MAERLNIVQFPEQRSYAIEGPLRKQIDYFDQNYREEDLPRDWWNINDVGFSMKRQMGLLAGTDLASVTKWSAQTERDFLGFCLEYLMRRKVFPFEYKIEGERFIDEKYGNREMLDMVDSKERAGAVLETARQAKVELLKGKKVVIVSPKGNSGITMDNGAQIIYKDTAVIYMEKDGERIIGTGFGLNFEVEDVRLLVEKLTGKALPKTASAADCIRAMATLDESADVKNPYDLVGTFATVRNDPNISGMVSDLSRRDTLYNFDAETKKIIQEFKEYVISGNLSEFDIQKALAATFLRLSKYMLNNQKGDKRIDYEEERVEGRFLPITYGQIMDEVRKIPGCAGGGGSVTSTLSIIERSAFTLEPDKYGERTFECPNKPACGKIITRPKNQLISNCPHCGANVKC